MSVRTSLPPFSTTSFSPRNNGVPDNPVPCPLCANPVNVGTGNKLQIETDYVGGPNTGLVIRRAYNSQDDHALDFGSKWIGSYGHKILLGNRYYDAIRDDGRIDRFTENGSTYTPDPDVTSRLSEIYDAGGRRGWKLVKDDDTTEYYTYPTVTIFQAILTSIVTRSGLTTTLAYNTDGQLATVTGPFGHTLTYSYDGGGHVSQILTPDGKAFKYAYDPRNNLTSVTYPDGKTRQYVYDDPNFPNALTGIIDEKGVRFATYAYDAQGRAISSEHAGGVEKTTVAYNADGSSTVTDPNAATHGYQFTTQFGLVKVTGLTGTPSSAAGAKAATYDANGFVASRTDDNGNVTTYVHDARGLETARTEAYGTPAARTITTTWHATFHLPASITEPGRTTTFGYDANGNLLTKTITAGGQTRGWSYTYSAVGQVLSIDGPRTDVADITRFTYDAKGNLATATDPQGRVTRFTSYDANGRLLRKTDPNGLVTTYTYNPRGWLKTRSVGGETTTYGYDAVGSVVSVTHPDGSKETYTYDAAQRPTGAKDSLGNRVVLTVDAMGDVTRERHLDPSNALHWDRRHVYDAANRLAQDIGAGGLTTTYAHDANGNLTSATDPLARKTTYGFDPLNRLVQAVDPAGGETDYAFDANDRLTAVTDPRGLVTGYGFDGLGNPTSTASPDAGAATRTFDAAGNVVTSTDARDIKTTNTYDALNRLTRSATSDGTVTTYRYDEGTNGIGHLTSMTYPGGTTSWSYDLHGRVTGRSQSAGTGTLATAYTYDAAGRRAGMVYPSGRTLAYGYDATGRISSITVDGQALLSNIGYEPFGSVAGWSNGNGTYHQRIYDADGSVTEVRLGFSAGGSSRSLLLERDDGRQIVDISDSALPKASFDYDDLGRLTRFLRGSIVRSFDYDANGNRLTMASDLTTTSYTVPPDSNRLLARSDGTVTTAYTYDAAGNMIGDGVRSYGYDGRGRLVKVTQRTGVTEYRINGLGQRVAKSGAQVTGSDNWFTYDDAGHLIGEYDGTGTPIAETVWLGDLPVAVLKPGSVHWVHPDHLGAPWVIANAAGNAVWSWARGPFGSGLPTGSLTYNLRLPGQYYDKETGLHYNYHRDYDPNLGRYIQSDPIGLAGGVNTYAYAGGDPVSKLDFLGLSDADDGATIELIGSYMKKARCNVGAAAIMARSDRDREEAAPGYKPENANLVLRDAEHYLFQRYLTNDYWWGGIAGRVLPGGYTVAKLLLQPLGAFPMGTKPSIREMKWGYAGYAAGSMGSACNCGF